MAASSAVARAGLGIARGARAALAERPASSGEAGGGGRPGILAVLALALALVIALAGAMRPASPLSEEVEAFRADVTAACLDEGVDVAWVDLILAMMQAESGGREDVPSVLGARCDVMQAAEGAWGWIVLEGDPERGLSAGTALASVYAGVLEFKGNLELWEGRFGSIDPLDLDKVGLVVQGYNFGARGWFDWCGERGVTAYSVEAAREYSETMMPAGAKGTPSHAEKVLAHYFSPALLGAGGAASSYLSAALAMASDDSVGYSQSTRNHNPNVDCSSLVWFALRDAGFPTAAIGAIPFTTYTMDARLAAAGFERFAFEEARDSLQPGDILLRDGHTEIVYDPRDWSTVGAHADLDGRDGDSSGREVSVSPGNARSGWEWAYRYAG